MAHKLFSDCMNCKDRVAGCHSTCEKYLEDKAKYDEAKAKQRAAREYDNYHIDRVTEMRTKELKRKKKRSKFLTKRSVN